MYDYCLFQDSIINATEDSQLQEALQKSIEETKAHIEPILPELTDDDSLSENDDLETFSDSDTEDQNVSNTPVKKSSELSGTNSKGSEKSSKITTTTKTAESGDSAIEKQSQVLNSNCSKIAENGKRPTQSSEDSNSAADDDKVESKWRNYLGSSEGE